MNYEFGFQKKICFVFNLIILVNNKILKRDINPSHTRYLLAFWLYRYVVIRIFAYFFYVKKFAKKRTVGCDSSNF